MISTSSKSLRSEIITKKAVRGLLFQHKPEGRLCYDPFWMISLVVKLVRLQLCAQYVVKRRCEWFLVAACSKARYHSNNLLVNSLFCWKLQWTPRGRLQRRMLFLYKMELEKLISFNFISKFYAAKKYSVHYKITILFENGANYFFTHRLDIVCSLHLFLSHSL